MNEARLIRISDARHDSRVPEFARSKVHPIEGDFWLAGVDTEFARLRLDSIRGLARIRERLKRIHRAIGPQQRIVWLVENENDLGLGPHEAQVVFDEYFSAEVASSAPYGDSKCTVLIGTSHREVVGFLISFRSLQRAHVRRVASHLQCLRQAGLPVAAVLITDEIGRSSSRDAADELARLSRDLWPGALVGPWLSRGDPKRLRRAIASTRVLTDVTNAVVGCEDGLRIQQLEPLFGELSIGADLSWQAVRDPETVPKRLVRDGGWLKAGAYYGQPFDSRTPFAAGGGQVPIRIIRSAAQEGFRATWSRWRGTGDDLPMVLDYYRFEAYLHRIQDVGMAQRYHEFNAFVRAAASPAIRTLLVELDAELTGPTCAFLVEECLQWIDAGGCVVTAGEEFLAAARAEAAMRANASSNDVLARQLDAHVYLGEIPQAAPLRADVLEFLKVIPNVLGPTLEIGSGTGRLAIELGPRAETYVGVDLDGLKMPTGLPGVVHAVADFGELPFGPNIFQSVVANNVLEHARDPLVVLRELRRVLKPGGALYALIPLDALSSSYELPAHLWKADIPSITRAFGMAGYRDVAIDAMNLYELGIAAAFPSCYGWVCRLVAKTPA